MIRIYRTDITLDYTFPVPPSLPFSDTAGIGYIEHKNDYGVGFREYTHDYLLGFEYNFYGLTNAEMELFIYTIYRTTLKSGTEWFYMEDTRDGYNTILSGHKFVMSNTPAKVNDSSGLFGSIQFNVVEQKDVL